ncbi:MAG: hypothetical protein ABSF88_12390 [Candidatus Aminicenantales bacterium]|jgi:cyclopropane fatty-acyl-phospholipid synthase-like methyltransferase
MIKTELNSLSKYFDQRNTISKNPAFINAYASSMDLDENSIYDPIVEEIQLLLCIKPSDAVLEIGCGTGEILKRMNADPISQIYIPSRQEQP